ncbi:DNA mismatch repair endonuclease MutL [Thermotoga profunda]|uniref:DNA mismatch repair endonuclease MutL n=1 Tax=Thermotoga profunda TaxID=1508420 RepID=UPI00059796ED|nr:DNA mismatch repair endonuclease MutL [Thermotoga profunda]
MKIKKLDPSVVSRIAAGEVVTGTHSVVKELVENSIDAGATRIVVELLNGGKDEIKVQDNGEGMDRDDLLSCFEPHATSKISNFEDIYLLRSFGFRGEALYSICQVSKTKITSRTDRSQVGHEVEIVAGNLIYEKPNACQKGTVVVVKDLFFNVPARRKFLKSSAVEGRMATETFERFCLSHPHIAFILLRDQQIVYNFVPSTLIERVKVLFKDVPRDSLISLDVEQHGMRLSGCVTKPPFFRNKRSLFTYVNGRYVVSSIVQSAIYSAYSDFLNQKEHPLVVLNLDVPPKDVDVNIHPQKLEVKFSDEEKVFKFIRDSVKGLFEKVVVRKIPVVIPSSKATDHKLSEPVDTYRNSTDVQISEHSTARTGYFLEPLNFNIIGIVRGRYIIVETTEALLVVDFHAAHERLIYDEIMSCIDRMPTIDLLMNIEIPLRKSELDVLERTDLLKKIGFDYQIQAGKIIVNRIPKWLNQGDLKEFLIQSIDEMKLIDLQSFEEVMRKIIADMACKNALRTKDRLDNEQAIFLVQQIFDKKITACPHGRPIIYSIEFRELDKFFERI